MTDCLCDLQLPDTTHAKAGKLTPVATAKSRLAELTGLCVGQERLRLEKSRGRILADDLLAVQTVPPHNNSAMDGYGLRLADMPDDQILAVSQRVPAGTKASPLAIGTAVRIFTGAPIPTGIDTIVPQEQVTVLGNNRIQVHSAPTRGQNVRYAGEDIKAGASLLKAGTRLGPAEIGLLASQGIAEVPVFSPLKVAVVATGDELIAPGMPLGEGQIYNSNAFTLGAAVESLGCEVTQYSAVADTFTSTRAALEQAAANHDVVITTGGVSVGDEDHIRPVLQQLGRLELWGIAMKPGKPFVFGFIDNTPVIGLPGNPMAALVTFEVLAADCLRRLMGARESSITPMPMPAGFSKHKSNPRQEYLRVVVDNETGRPRAVLAGSQSSGVLSVASSTDGYLIIPPHEAIIEGKQYGFIHRNQFYQ
jgi:molybdopterin molybdotransferase